MSKKPPFMPNSKKTTVFKRNNYVYFSKQKIAIPIALKIVENLS